MDTLSTTEVGVALGAGIEAIYAGVDWISCTLPADSPGRWVWTDEGREIVNEIAQEGHELEAFTRNGYSGTGAGGSFCGARDDGSYLQLCGAYAGRFLDRIARDDLHISRLDIQTTVRYRVHAPALGAAARQKAIDANAALTGNRRRRIWYMEGNDGGYTLYIGAPKSDLRSRLYNKAIQSEDPIYARCWRYEVMARNEFAHAYYKQVMVPVDRRPRQCAAMVASWYNLRGIEPDWAAYIPLITLPLIQEVPSDAQKKLDWLRSQVRPALRWLVTNGFEDVAMEALGLVSSEFPSYEPDGWKDWRFPDA